MARQAEAGGLDEEDADPTHEVAEPVRSRPRPDFLLPSGPVQCAIAYLMRLGRPSYATSGLLKACWTLPSGDGGGLRPARLPFLARTGWRAPATAAAASAGWAT